MREGVIWPEGRTIEVRNAAGRASVFMFVVGSIRGFVVKHDSW